MMREKLNVYEAVQVRLDKIFSDFDNVYVSFPEVRTVVFC